MPCDGSYLNPNKKEENSKKMANMLVYLDSKGHLKEKTVNKNVPGGLVAVYRAARDYYGGVKDHDNFVRCLCETLKTVPDEFIYNGYDKERRTIADWWDEHKEADRVRENREAHEKIKDAMKIMVSQDIEGLENKLNKFMVKEYGDTIPKEYLKCTISFSLTFPGVSGYDW